MIDASHVHFNRDARPILTDINWHVELNQHWVIIGPNGSGKSTLLNMIAGYEWPSDGTISVLGNQYGKCYLPEVRKSIGWVGMSLQHRIMAHHRFRNAPVEDIVAAGDDAALAYYGERDESIRNKTAFALKRTRMDSFAEHPFSVLSQGEQKKVLISRALIHTPKILILDEPCAGLDPVARVEFLNDLTMLVEEKDGPSILHVTHHIEDIGPWTTHVLALKDGKVFYQGDLSGGITSDLMSRLYDHPCEVTSSNGYYSLDVSSSSASVL
jgi:iron complex transport system ATP-binding protein